MISSFASLFLAEAEAAQQQPGGINPMYLILIMVVMMYFMVFRPQRRAQREHLAKLAALKSGDEVVTNGGIHGLITNVADRTVTLKIADNVKIKVERQSVATILKKADEPETAADNAKEESSGDTPIASKAVS